MKIFIEKTEVVVAGREKHCEELDDIVILSASEGL